jgi:hypothetical protein
MGFHVNGPKLRHLGGVWKWSAVVASKNVPGWIGGVRGEGRGPVLYVRLRMQAGFDDVDGDSDFVQEAA